MIILTALLIGLTLSFFTWLYWNALGQAPEEPEEKEKE